MTHGDEPFSRRWSEDAAGRHLPVDVTGLARLGEVSPTVLSGLRRFIESGAAEALLLKGALTGDELAAWCDIGIAHMSTTLNILRHHGIVTAEKGRFRLGAIDRATSDAMIFASEFWAAPPTRQGNGRDALDANWSAEADVAMTPEWSQQRWHLAAFGDAIATAIGRELAPLAARHLATARTVAQIGGGQGELLEGVLAGHHHLRGVFAIGSCADERAKDFLAGRHLQHRVELIPVDLPDLVPAADCIIVSRWLRHLPSPQCVRLLSAVAARLVDARGAGQLWYIDGPLSPRYASTAGEEEPDRRWHALLRGRERPADEVRALLHRAGMSVEARRGLPHDQYMMIAVPR